MSRHVALLLEFSGVLRDVPQPAPVVDRLLHAFVRVMGADGGAVTLAADTDERTLLAASDDVAEHFEELQDVVREGPTVDAVRTGRPVSTLGDGLARIWPLLGQAASSRPREVWVYPMKPESAVMGAISVYRAGEAREMREPDVGMFLAGAVAMTILGRVDDDTARLSWSGRDRVDHATGMVMAQLRVPPVDALTLLRMRAFAEGVPLSEVADQVVRRTLHFSHDDTEDGPT